MREKMRELAELKELIAAIKSTQDRIYADAVTNNPEYQELARKKEIAKMRADALEYELENWALSEFRNTGGKKPMPKLTVRENTKVEYDLTTAEQWAKTNLPDAFNQNPKKSNSKTGETMSNSHEIAKKLSEKMYHSGWRVDSPFGTFDWVTFEEFVQKVLAYELSEVPDEFETEPELQFP